MTLLIRNGRVWQEDGFVEADLLIRDGAIAAVGTIPDRNADEIIDARGHAVLPGMIDIHTHLDDRIGPYVLADDIASGTRCAVENGITTVGTFVTETAETPLVAALDAMAAKVRGRAHCDVLCHVTPTRFDAGGWRAIDELLERGIRTVKLYTTYREAGICSDYGALEDIFMRLGGRGVRFLVHCEDDAILQRAREVVPDWSSASAHAAARPGRAEVAAIDAVLDRAAAMNVPVHVVHVSTPEGAGHITAARRDQDVTCETCPQYLVLDDGWLDRPDGHRWICSPPLRSTAARAELAAMAARGVFDIFASDHCPFLREDKDRGRGDARRIANGLPGIGALPHLVYGVLRAGVDDPLLHLGARLSNGPARVLGLYPRKGVLRAGSDADVVILSTDGPARPIRSSLADTYEPYPDFFTTLTVHSVIVHGHRVVEDGRLLEPHRLDGRCAWES